MGTKCMILNFALYISHFTLFLLLLFLLLLEVIHISLHNIPMYLCIGDFYQ